MNPETSVVSIPRRSQPELLPAAARPFGCVRSVASRAVLALSVWTALLACGSFDMKGAEAPLETPVPSSTYMAVVYRYADAMLQHGRDRHGPIQTGLLLSALDRAEMKPLTRRPATPAGIREIDRAGSPDGPLTGANLQHDENLLRMLPVLTGLSGKAVYRDAANAALEWFLNHAASPATQLLPWGEHLAWDTAADRVTADGPDAVHEFFRPWLLWDDCFDVAPEASRRFAEGLWRHQVHDPQSGAFDRHAGFARHATWGDHDFPRHAGFFLRTWAVAYDRTKEAQFLTAIEALLGRYEAKAGGAAGRMESRRDSAAAWPPSNLSLSIDCAGSALRVPAGLGGRLRALSAKIDEGFCALPHPMGKDGAFLAVTSTRRESAEDESTTLWEARYGALTTAQVAMMCVSRYDNDGAPKFLELIVGAADAYAGKLPSEAADVWPGTLGQAISLQLAAWRHTARESYLAEARRLADWAVATFFDGGQALPRASRKSEHYESITGGDTLALALLELHLHILHITAVRCPQNTLDR